MQKMLFDLSNHTSSSKSIQNILALNTLFITLFFYTLQFYFILFFSF